VFHPKFEPGTFRKIEALSLDPTCPGVAKKREIVCTFCRSTQVEQNVYYFIIKSS